MQCLHCSTDDNSLRRPQRQTCYLGACVFAKLHNHAAAAYAVRGTAEAGQLKPAHGPERSGSCGTQHDRGYDADQTALRARLHIATLTPALRKITMSTFTSSAKLQARSSFRYCAGVTLLGYLPTRSYDQPTWPAKALQLSRHSLVCQSVSLRCFFTRYRQSYSPLKVRTHCASAERLRPSAFA